MVAIQSTPSLSATTQKILLLLGPRPSVSDVLKILIEPSSATVIAAIRKHPEIFTGKKVGAVISGGNIHPAEWVRLVNPS